MSDASGKNVSDANAGCLVLVVLGVLVLFVGCMFDSPPEDPQSYLAEEGFSNVTYGSSSLNCPAEHTLEMNFEAQKHGCVVVGVVCKHFQSENGYKAFYRNKVESVDCPES